ncbi:MAG: hypothetical protein JWQ96_2887 [Segetibacter sp.]|nr:hypothetical protein [Segetibacter sp.]
MKKLINLSLLAGITILISCKMPQPKVTLIKTVTFNDFPSGSALEFHNNKLYLAGDDATQFLILDTNYNRLDSITLDSARTPRVPKDIKLDFEASTIINNKGKEQLLLLGSASTTVREKLFVVDLGDEAAHQLQVYSTSELKKQLEKNSIKEVNFEGAAYVHGTLIISNRANKSQPNNHLIFTDLSLIDNFDNIHFRIAKLNLEVDGKVVGVSGLTYEPKNDRLYFCVSTEETSSAYDDGEIGESYIGYINNISEKTTGKEISPDLFFSLDNVNPVFKNQKIESICIESIKGNIITLHLVADNDDGTSKLFKLTLEIEKDKD